MESGYDTARELLATHGFTSAAITSLVEFHAVSSAQEFSHPWTDLEQQLGLIDVEQIYLLGYGSLLNPVSAARSVANTPPEGHPPVVALGARRVFNYRMPEPVLARYDVKPGLLDRACLNAEPIRESAINGRLIKFAITDLPGLRIREAAYDLCPVSCLFWNEPESEPFTAYALCCQQEFYQGVPYIDNSLQPFKPYCNICRTGAEMVSPEFLSFYLKTSFLTDRRTTLFDLEIEGW